MLRALLSTRTLFASLLGWTVLAVHFARGQALADTNNPKLTEHFSFSRSQDEGYAVSEIVKTIELHDHARRAEALEAANTPVFAQALDLLRYVPIKLSKSDGDDFFLPSYLHPGYREVPAETHLLDPR